MRLGVVPDCPGRPIRFMTFGDRPFSVAANALK
jgi:hypothetical protein